MIDKVKETKMPAWAEPIRETLIHHDKRFEALEETFTDIGEVKRIVERIWKVIKWGAPSVITAAVTAGYINGDFATLLKAVFQ